MPGGDCGALSRPRGLGLLPGWGSEDICSVQRGGECLIHPSGEWMTAVGHHGEMGNSFIAQLRTEMNCVGMDLHPGAEGTAHFQHALTGVCCLHPPQNLGMKGRSQHIQNAC